jgi:hypothetical protein
MSLHISVIAIQGDHIDRAGELLGVFGFAATAEPAEVAGWEAASKALDDHNCKAACSADGWTVIIDPDLVLMLDERACADISRRLGTQLCGLVCEGVSGTYGFILFRGGTTVRRFCSTNGVVADDAGEPLPAESDFDKSRATESGVIDVLGRLGFDYWSLERADRVLIYCEAAPPMARLAGKEPWWRIW